MKKDKDKLQCNISRQVTKSESKSQGGCPRNPKPLKVFPKTEVQISNGLEPVSMESTL